MADRMQKPRFKQHALCWGSSQCLGCLHSRLEVIVFLRRSVCTALFPRVCEPKEQTASSPGSEASRVWCLKEPEPKIKGAVCSGMASLKEEYPAGTSDPGFGPELHTCLTFASTDFEFDSKKKPKAGFCSRPENIKHPLDAYGHGWSTGQGQSLIS